MNFEIEFHPVGDNSKAGDAITVRYGVDGNYKVMVIDGGTDDSGECIVEHIKSVYGPFTTVSDVINTHPDSDHACGLRKVMRELPVERFWVHGLWRHAAAITDMFEDGRWTADGLEKKIRSEYPVIVELLDIAAARDVTVLEPFAGATIGPFTVLSPNMATYRHLIPQFRRTPDANVELLKQRDIWLGDGLKQNALAAFLQKAFDSVATWIPDAWDVETLREGATTAAENESSTVLWGEFGSNKVLLTADAGVNALHWAANAAQTLGIDLTSANLVQVPHHGSRSNVTPSTLDRIVGPRILRGAAPVKSAIVSAPKDDATHPRKIVLNAFLRRGAPVASTQGSLFRYYRGMAARPNMTPARVFSFFNQVEAYD